MRRLHQLNVFVTRLGIAGVFALSFVYALNYRGAPDLIPPIVVGVMGLGLLVAIRGARGVPPNDDDSITRDIR